MGLRIAQVATIDMSIHLLLMDHIRALKDAGHDVVAVCAPGPFVEQIRAAGIEVETVGMARELSASRDWKALRELKKLFRRREFDVVHTHTPKAGLIGPVAARLASVPVVVHTIHGLMFHDRMPASRRSVFWGAEKWTATFTHRLLSQSREDIKSAVASGLCSPEKISYIGNGIDVGHFAPVAKSETCTKVVVGSAGRLVAEKGFPELFEAARRLAARNPNLHFVVVGPTEADQNDAIPQQLLDELTRSGVVEFPGWGEDMRSWYAGMDMFVLPSHREGIPRACMEAASMGLPVIATDIRGCREVVKNGETGILVPVRAPGALADAIEKLATDAGLRRRMGTAGREHILANFQQRQVLDRLVAYYADIEAGLGRKAARA